MPSIRYVKPLHPGMEVYSAPGYSVRVGGSVEVSDQEAARLLETFPGCFVAEAQRKARTAAFAAPPASTAQPAPDWGAMSMAELRAAAKERGVKSSGKKAQLIARLEG